MQLGWCMLVISNYPYCMNYISNIFNQNAPVIPTSKNTPSSGRIIAKMIFKTSLVMLSCLLSKAIGCYISLIYFIENFNVNSKSIFENAINLSFQENKKREMRQSPFVWGSPHPPE